MDIKQSITGSKSMHLNLSYLMKFSVTFTFENIGESYLSPGKQKISLEQSHTKPLSQLPRLRKRRSSSNEHSLQAKKILC
jgi:hypothetical protein